MAEQFSVTFLGGLGEIGRNCMVFEQQNQLLLLDCGLMFPDADMHGVDLVLPDFTWLRDNAERIVGCIATHGHEDHVGGLPYLLRDVSFPVYGSPLTLRLARGRIEEAGLLGRTELIPVADGERRRIGVFDVEFLPTTHSVPYAFATVLHTPQGVVLHSGDFKLDLTPVDGRRTDLARMGSLAKNPGIRLLLSDSTNAEEAGHSPSETSVAPVFARLFHEHAGRRIITASFASHLHRIQQLADAAIASGRKVATLGLSMRRNVASGIELGVLHIPPSSLIDIEDIDNYPPGQICVISTGSQGEPMSALSRLARSENKLLKLADTDTIILSSHAIPGNEGNVNKVIDGLIRGGAKVVHSGVADVHATGHAQADELKTLLAVTTPEWFVPVHGEYRHLVAHAELARIMGVADDHITICEDGHSVTLTDTGLERGPSIPAGYLYVDGILDDIGPGVLRDRQTLADEGVVVVIATIDGTTGQVVSGPEIVTRGWVHAPTSNELLDQACDQIATALEKAFKQGLRDPLALEREMRSTTGKFIKDATGRRPMIVPVVMET
ncbi:MAG: ribonuclease J [Ilumatobacteraceae bacterium]